MPLMSALLTTDVNVITYWPLEFAASVNPWMLAMFCPPEAAKMSKLVSTCVPLVVTLNVREPAVVKKVSAKCRGWQTWTTVKMNVTLPAGADAEPRQWLLEY
jgi:hypothetical protein